MAENKELVDAEMAKYRTIQEEVQVLANQRQTFAQQANENQMVQKELELCEADSKVYKMIGPVLLKQDLEEAKSNVAKRIQFISNEMDKVSKKVEKKESDAVLIRNKIMEIQTNMQKAAVEGARSVAAGGQ